MTTGTKTHALKPASLAVLRRIAFRPERCHLFNPDVVDKLIKQGLAIVEGRPNRTLLITKAGRAALTEINLHIESALVLIEKCPTLNCKIQPEILTHLWAEGLIKNTCARGVVEITAAGRQRLSASQIADEPRSPR